MKLLAIGFGNYLSTEKILAMLAPDSAPIKRLISDSRDRGLLVDASFGRSTRAVILMSTGHVILSARSPDELADLQAEADGLSERSGN